MYRISKLTVLLLLLVLSATSCLKEKVCSDRNMRIGVLMPLTGNGSSTGESISSAVGYALEDAEQYLAGINSGYGIEMVSEDTESDPAAAIIAYNNLKNKGINIIVGPCLSVDVTAVKPLADADGILLISPASAANSLSIPDDNLFRLVPDIMHHTAALAALIVADDIDMVIPVALDDVWGNDVLESLKHHLANSGKTVMEAVKYPSGLQDFNNVVDQLANRTEEALLTGKPEKTAILMVSYGEGTSILRQAASKKPLNLVRWYGSSGYANNKTLLTDETAVSFAFSRNVVCPSFGLDPAARSKWEPLVNKLEENLGRKPEIYSLLAYDSFRLAVLTQMTAGYNDDIQTLKEAFVTLANNYYGVTGWTQLNEAGDRTSGVYDFWGIVKTTNTSGPYEWKIVARFSYDTGELVRIK